MNKWLPSMMPRPLGLGIIILTLCVLAGCATYSEGFRAVEDKMAKKQYSEALQLIEKSQGDERDRVLYLMNRGLLMRMMGDYEASNQALEEAKTLSRSLEAVSVSEQAGALAVNDSLRAYVGDPYELMYLHLYKALNYIDLGNLSDARIEILQLDVRLQELKNANIDDDGFIRYFSGIVYEAMGEADNAMISYRQAYEAYSRNKPYVVALPEPLKKDLLRMTKRLGFKDEYEKFKDQFGAAIPDQPAKLPPDHGELVLFINTGLVPVKGEKAIHVQSVGGPLVRVALPFYQTRPLSFHSAQIVVNGQTVQAAQVADLQKMAVYTLDQDIGGITARAVARAVVKYQTSQKASDQNGLVGLALNITNVVSERADTRSWSTLPQSVAVVRSSLPEGFYDVELVINGDSSTKQILFNVEIKKRKIAFRSVQWLGQLH